MHKRNTHKRNTNNNDPNDHAHQLADGARRVVVEVVEAELLPGDVGDVGGVRVPRLRRRHVGLHRADGEAHEAVRPFLCCC